MQSLSATATGLSSSLYRSQRSRHELWQSICNRRARKGQELTHAVQTARHGQGWRAQATARAAGTDSSAGSADQPKQDRAKAKGDLEASEDMAELKRVLDQAIDDGANPVVVQLGCTLLLVAYQITGNLLRRKRDEVSLVQKPRSFGIGHDDVLLYMESENHFNAFTVVDRAELKALKNYDALIAFAISELEYTSTADGLEKCRVTWGIEDGPTGAAPMGVINNSRYEKIMDSLGCLCLWVPGNIEWT